MRAFYANGVEKMHISWAVEGLPTLLHLSLFMFFCGLVIFLYNVDQEVFQWVVSWIGLFSVVYGLITLLPLIRPDSPYYSPHSILAWFLYASIQYVTFKVLASITSGSYGTFEARERYRELRDRYRGWISRGMEKITEEMAEEQSSEIDIGILRWTIDALGDDHSLEKFIEAVPGFFDSKLVKDIQEHFPRDLSIKLYFAFRGFLSRTLSSNLVIDSVKLHRLDISLTAINLIRSSGDPHNIIQYILFRHWDQVPKTVEIWHTLAPWCTNNDPKIAPFAQAIVAKVLATVQERDGRWFELAAHVYDLPERDLRDYFTRDDDSVSLALLTQLTRTSFRSDLPYEVLGAFSQIDVRNTLLGLRHDFCTLWNEIVQNAMKQGSYSKPVYILREIRHHYIALHQGTPATPTAFSPSTDYTHYILWRPSSYPLCDIAIHRPVLVQPADSPDALPGHSTSGGGAVSWKVNEATIIARPPPLSSLTIPSEIEGRSQATSPTLQDHTSPRPTDASPLGAVAAALQNILSAATYSNPLLPAGLSVPASPPPSRVPPLPNAESPTLFSTTTPSRATGNATLPRLRARGLVNTESMCFANSVLQLLVHSPPFWELFRGLGDLKGLRGAAVPETSDGATPLLDATLRFFEEFIFKEKEPPPPQEPPQQVAGGNLRGNEETKKEINTKDFFEPTYVYHSMKGKRRLKHLLVRSRATYRPAVTDLCWPNVFRRANSRMRKSFSVSTSTRLMKNWSRYSFLLVVTSRPLLHPKTSGRLSQARLTWEEEASWCVKYFISRYLELGIADGRMFMSRPSQLSRPWGAYSMESSARPCARQT